MLTDPKLKSQIDALWEKLWTGGLSNPLDAIEQLSYLLFLKRLDDMEKASERRAKFDDNYTHVARIPDEIRWSNWANKTGKEMLKHVQEVVFPELKKLGTEDLTDDEDEQQRSSFAEYMENAEFKIRQASVLVQVCNAIDEMHISQQNQDVQGDLYEYMLSKLNTAGRNGQFRTPRHIIHMMVKMLDPQPGERIGDLAAGTCGFLVNAYQYILAQHTPEDSLKVDADGWYQQIDGSLLTPKQRDFLQNEAFRGYDNDSGMTMLRIGSMNLMLHGIEFPRFYYADTLSNDYDEPSEYDVILMNPPFKGAVDKDNVNEHISNAKTKKSELLFLHQILRVLDMGGRAGVIIPDGVLFGSSNAHVAIRKKLVEEHGLIGVVSMPSGVFKPYAGVSTAVLFFQKGGTTERIWFYDMAYDGFTLDDKRNPTPNQNDIPDILEAWNNRDNADYGDQRAQYLADYRQQIDPLHTQRLELEREINRLRYEAAIASSDDDMAARELAKAQAQLDTLHESLQPLKEKIDAVQRQFWVSKADVKANKYDLSASRYRAVEQDEVFYEDPRITAERIQSLEKHISAGMDRILGQLND